MTQPIFKSIFGKVWDKMPEVMHKHYANRPFSDEKFTAKGHLDINFKWYLKPIIYISGILPPYIEKSVPVTVDFISKKNSNAFCLNRTFYFKGKKPFNFHSKLLPVKNSEVMEILKYGLAWHCNYLWQNNKVILKHKGYSLRVFGRNISLPITWLLGNIEAEESVISEDEFSMFVKMTHPIFGKIYEYKGQFRII